MNDQKLYFCTLFDSHYLSRGLAMVQSLIKAQPNSQIYVFAFDDPTFQYLQMNPLPQVTPISLWQLEETDRGLLQVKPSRSRGEYCWTATPCTLLYCIEKFGLDHCTYVDADLYFYSDPTPLFLEMGTDSCLITPHWYSPRYDRSELFGKYCVQFVSFKNDPHGLTVLKDWRGACLEWCFNRVEDGKFGDQKYLDSWTEKFSGVHVLKNRMGGVAPWNIQQYSIDDPAFKPIFYHFHGLKFLDSTTVELGYYQLGRRVFDQIYLPYIQILKAIHVKLARSSLPTLGEAANSGRPPVTLRKFFGKFRRKLQGEWNQYKI